MVSNVTKDGVIHRPDSTITLNSEHEVERLTRLGAIEPLNEVKAKATASRGGRVKKPTTDSHE